MFASLLLLAAAQQIVIPLGGRPQRIEPPRAPIESAGPRWAAACNGSDDWDKRAPPVRIHANTYYVGTCGISAILITDKQGHILIDSGTEKGAQVVADNITRLGFRLADVRYLLHSHEHFDHVGGMARLQQLTGAQVLASPAAQPALGSGTPTAADPQAGMHAPFARIGVARVIRDGEMLRLGDTVLTAITTPGHTPGALSWRWGSCDGGVCRQMVYADSLSPVSRDDYRFSDHPAVVQSFRSSIAKIALLNCDIILTPHPSASKLDQRIAAGKPLLDPEGCKAYASALTKRLDDRLASEAGKK